MSWSRYNAIVTKELQRRGFKSHYPQRVYDAFLDGAPASAGADAAVIGWAT